MSEALEADLLAIIGARIRGHERSQQVQLGPSGLGTPCPRKLGFRLAEIPALDVGGREPPWRPTVGTAVHTWLNEMLVEVNKRELARKGFHSSRGGCPVPYCARQGELPPILQPHTPRWLLWEEGEKIEVGTINGQTIDGTPDAYDRLSKTVIDWKIPGPAAIKSHRAAMPEEYRVQAHVYGRGLVRLGHPVETVAMLFLPANGELSDHLWWSEPYYPQIAAQAFKRARDIKAAGEELGWDVLLPKLKTVNDHCVYCDWYAPNTTDPLECAGDPSIFAIQTPPSPEDLLG